MERTLIRQLLSLDSLSVKNYISRIKLMAFILMRLIVGDLELNWPRVAIVMGGFINSAAAVVLCSSISLEFSRLQFFWCEG